jgi:sensor histidine kinase YesM
LFPVIFFLGKFQLAASNESRVLHIESIESRMLGKYLSLFVDKNPDRTEKITPRDLLLPANNALFKQIEVDRPLFGFDNFTYWLKMTVVNGSQFPKEALLEINGPNDEFILRRYRSFDHKLIESHMAGFEVNESVYIPHYNPIFQIKLEPHTEETWLIKVRKRISKSINYTLYSPQHFINKERSGQIGKGIYYGILLALIGYNFFLFIFLGDRTYLYYILYLASYGMLQASIYRQGDEYIWTNSLIMKKYSVPFSAGTMIIFISLFTGSFLNIREIFRPGYYIFRFFLFMGGFIILTPLILPNYITARIISFTGLFFIIIVIISCIVALKKGYILARYFLLAWATFLVCLVIYLLATFGVFTSMNFFIDNGLWIGSAAEAILLSVALAYRIEIINSEKRFLEYEALENKRIYEKAMLKSHRIELEMLKKIISPHFLLNTLTVLSAGVLTKPKAAFQLVTALAEELNKLFRFSGMPTVSLRDEIQLCRAHLKIMSIRKTKEYKLETKNISGTEAMPPLIFHTLVENAISHDRSKSETVVFHLEKIANKATENQGNTANGPLKEIYIFSSPFNPDDTARIKESTGIGLEYIKSRLEEAFGENWDMGTYLAEQCFNVKISISHNTADNTEP